MISISGFAGTTGDGDLCTMFRENRLNYAQGTYEASRVLFSDLAAPSVTDLIAKRSMGSGGSILWTGREAKHLTRFNVEVVP